jgi:uncharacterized protein YqeY
MTFEEMLRQKLATAPFRSREKELLKVVLGEVQRKDSSGLMSHEQGNAIIKKMVKGNEETIALLKPDDPRRSGIEEENTILSSFLPSYLTAEQIREKLAQNGIDVPVMEAKSDGQAVGVAMGFLKKAGLSVEGDTVKKLVGEMRA